MSRPTLKELFEIYDADEMMTMDGFDDCIVGVVERFGLEPILCYDKEKVLSKLVKDGMTKDMAVEYFEYNQIGAWVGDGTPCFITLITTKKEK